MASSLQFEKLTLNDNVDIDVYEEALNFAFLSPDIRNIAISGAYGAGKSSVLASYKKKHSKKSFIHISLAHFQDEPSSDSSGELDEPVLEGKILNQLIHQLPPNNIPQTNFKIKQNINKKQIISITAFTMLTFLCSLFIFKHNVWYTFVDQFTGCFGNLLSVTKSPYALLFAGIILIILCSIFTYKVIKMQKLKRFLKRITFQGNEIEIFENDDESFFDKYLNEVLYLFENSNVDAIVFEDMDRFEMNQIFERLREINTLVNVQLEKKKDKKVLRFIYLLRDDVFVSKDRTKFFDYIIPIVPVLDATNSYDQFILHLKKNDVYNKLDTKFLQGLSLYVDDMRLLKNICNEFLIYYNRVNTTELDYNKMFALITYKNLFPRDFSDLQLGRGFVFSLFSQKKMFVVAEEERMKKLIDDKNEEIQYCRNEELESLEELETIRAKKQSRIPNFYPARHEEQKKYDEWYANEYPKRKQAIENKIANRVETLNIQLEKLNTQYNKLQVATLKDIITRDNVDDIFKINSINEIGEVREYKEIKGNEYFSLLKYLIRNGYIDESYADYMTYFYENSLSRIDKIFLRSVTDKKAKPSSYELKDPKLVVSRLAVLDFEEKETLNFNLLKYLFEKMANSKQLETMINQLSKESNLEFILQFFNYTRNWGNYVAVLNKLWPSFFKEMLETDVFPRKTIYDYSIYSLYFSSLEDISKINIDNCLTDFITNASDYLYITEPDIEKLIKGFNHLGVRFKAINYEASEKDLFRVVYENSLYDLNFANIELMLTTMEKFTNNDEIIHSNFSLISTNSKSPLYKYVMCNIEQYISIVLDNCQEKITDKANALLFIINCEAISDEYKHKYIEYLTTIVDDISLIDNTSLWGHCLKSNIIKFSENNIYLYYHYIKNFDSNLIYYINNFENSIDMKKVVIDDDEEAGSLFAACLKCFEIDNAKYRQILTSMNRADFEDFTIKDIPNDKMKILIEEKIIKFTSKSLVSLRENYDDVCCYFIEKNFDSYMDNMTSELFLFDELIEILEWNVDDVHKLTLLGFTSKPISILNMNCSIEVRLHILQHNLNDSDIPELRRNYHAQDTKIKSFLLEDAILNIISVIRDAQDISYSLIKDLFSSEVLDQSNKLSLLAERIPLLSRDECFQAFNAIGRTDFANIFETRKHPKFSVCRENQSVLDNLQTKGWIYDYYTDESDSNYYKIRRNKPHKKLNE